jgi:hypothetical protein
MHIKDILNLSFSKFVYLIYIVPNIFSFENANSGKLFVDHVNKLDGAKQTNTFPGLLHQQVTQIIND